MSEAVAQFVRACHAVTPLAAAMGHPPFTAALRGETPANSGPYVYSPAAFRDRFGSDARRRRMIAAAEAALDALRRSGVVWHLVLVGGSFVHGAERPSDLDGLVVYSLATRDPAEADRIVAGIPATLRRHAGIDFKFCPIDIDPVVLVKRLLFFANIFGFDKRTGQLSRGNVMIVPDTATDPAVQENGECPR